VLQGLIKDMSRIKQDFDLKWERLLKYIETDNQMKVIGGHYQSSAVRSDPILVQEIDRGKFSATVHTLKSHLISVEENKEVSLPPGQITSVSAVS
jgi:hypothetical protein